MAQGIVIRNSQEQLAVDTMKKAHTLLCEKLGVKTDLTFQRKCNWGKDAKHAGWYRSSEKLVALNFRNMYGATVGDLLEVLVTKCDMQYKMLKVGINLEDIKKVVCLELYTVLGKDKLCI